MTARNEAYLGDLIKQVPDDEMRQRYRAGEYGNIRPEYAKGWRRVMGRDNFQDGHGAQVKETNDE